MVDEYDVSYGIKEWLLQHKWKIVAFNPPGAQGTLTIPNPEKDPKYRGQTGSESPDLIAVKNSKYLLIIESKPTFDKEDVKKLVRLFKNKERMNLLLNIVSKVCKANNIEFSRKDCVVILGKGYGEKLNLIKGIETFHVSVLKDWNSDTIDVSTDPLDYIKVDYYPTNKEMEKIVKY